MSWRRSVGVMGVAGVMAWSGACGEKPAAPSAEPPKAAEPAAVAEVPAAKAEATPDTEAAAAGEAPAAAEATDTTAPTWADDAYVEVRLEPPAERPAGDEGAATGPRVGLSWPAAKDDEGVVRYEVTSNGRLLATVEAPKTEVVVPVPAPSSDDDEVPTSRVTFTVDAVDAAGNRAPCPVGGGYTWPSVLGLPGLGGMGGDDTRAPLGASLGGEGSGRLGGKAGLLAPSGANQGLRAPGVLGKPGEGAPAEEDE